MTKKMQSYSAEFKVEIVKKTSNTLMFEAKLAENFQSIFVFLII